MAVVTTVFVFAVALPPIGVATHTHPGGERAHVHVWLAVSGETFESEDASSDELPFADNETPLDWWSRDRSERHREPGLWHQRLPSTWHAHSFAPLQPTLVAALPDASTVGKAQLGPRGIADDPRHQALPNWHSRAPPAASSTCNGERAFT